MGAAVYNTHVPKHVFVSSVVSDDISLVMWVDLSCCFASRMDNDVPKVQPYSMHAIKPNFKYFVCVVAFGTAC